MSIQSSLRKDGVEEYMGQLGQYANHAHACTNLLVQLKPELGNKSVRAFEVLQREGKRVLESGEVTSRRTRDIVNQGREIIILVESVIPEVRRIAEKHGYPAHIRRAQQELKLAVRDLSEMENAMRSLGEKMLRYAEDAARKLSSSGGSASNGITTNKSESTPISLIVNNKEINPDSSNYLGEIQWVAKSADERPNFAILIQGPTGMPVRIEFKHDYNTNFRWNLKGKEQGKLEDLNSNCGLHEMQYGVWQLVLPVFGEPVKLNFSAIGLCARHVFSVAFGTTKELYFHIDIDYLAYRFVYIPYDGANYNGYGEKTACWGLPELKTFIDKFAALHFKETGKKPYIGNKAISDGVKYDPHDGVSHAGGYGVDIDFGVETGNAKVDEAKYDQKAHMEQVKRYLECGAILVYTADEDIVKLLGRAVIYDKKHDTHDHINVL